ncbi:MAG: Holliday junction resolvase RuvX [Bacteroidales bacterium]
MGRVMGIDVGQKRIGLAVTDPLQIFATGLDTVPVSGIFDYLIEYTEKEAVELFVVGSPVQMNNKPSESVKYTEPFVKKLTKVFPDIPVRRIDERFTSKIAKQVMISAGTGREARRNKALVDKISAVIMLQSYIDQDKF